MMSRKQYIRSKLHLYSAIIFVSAIILTGIYSTLTSSYLPSVNPITILKSIAEVGFNWLLFFGIVIVLYGAAFIKLHRDLTTSGDGTDIMHPNRVGSDSGLYGTARFEQPWDYRSLAQIRPIDKCVGTILGQLGTDGSECIDRFPDPKDPTAHINQHTFALGASGSGKTFTVGKTYCYQCMKLGHSVIHTDPKGELFRDMADCYRQHGYIVRRLDFINPEKSDGWDCMKTLREETSVFKVQELSAKFAAAVVNNIGLRDIYLTASQALLQALVLRAVLDDNMPDEEKNIKTVYEWLTNPNGVDFLDQKFDITTMNEKLKNCVPPYTTFRTSSPNLLGNITVSLAAGIQILSTGIISTILSTPDIDLMTPGISPCAYFIQFPVPNLTYKFPIALFFTMLFETLTQYAVSRERLDIDVDFFMDEFAQIGVLPGWAELMSVIRSYGINVFMIIQTMAQFINLYKDSSETIVSACATWLMLGANDQNSAEYFSKRCGQTTIQVESESREGIRKILGLKNSIADRTSVGKGKTALMNPDEIMKLPPNQLIILFQRHNPILAQTVPNKMHPYSKIGKKVFDEDEPDITDTKRREELRREQASAIEKYKQTHDYLEQPDNIDDAPYMSPSSIMHDVIEIIKEDINSLINLIGNKKEERSKAHQEKKIKTKQENKEIKRDKADKPVLTESSDDIQIDISDELDINNESELNDNTSNAYDDTVAFKDIIDDQQEYDDPMNGFDPYGDISDFMSSEPVEINDQPDFGIDQSAADPMADVVEVKDNVQVQKQTFQEAKTTSSYKPPANKYKRDFATISNSVNSENSPLPRIRK